MLRRRILRAATALAALLALAPASAHAVPLPAVTEITGPTSPFGAALQNLVAAGYEEREYRVTLNAPNVYAYSGSGTAVTASAAPPSLAGAYRSRMIVRKPTDPAAFNGNVLVEMLNTTAGLDLDVEWQQAHRHLIREGWAYVGITVQQTGLNALTLFERDPTRYAGQGLFLMTPAAAASGSAGFRDPSLAWDLTSQVGALLESGDASSPLAGLAVDRTVLTGQSQMAGYAVTYVNAIHPLAQVYDAFLVVSRGSTATNLGFSAAPTSTSAAQRTLGGGGAPVVNVQAETDTNPSPFVRRADADNAADRFRLWEVPGSSHNDEWAAQQSVDMIERDLPFPAPAACPWVPPSKVGNFPLRYVIHAALNGLDRWAGGGAAPPVADRITLGLTGIARDGDGNALGGLRIPPIEVPIASYAPTSPGPGFCFLTGTETPFSQATLDARYRNHGKYVSGNSKAAGADVATGYLVAADGEEIVRAAAQSDIGKK